MIWYKTLIIGLPQVFILTSAPIYLTSILAALFLQLQTITIHNPRLSTVMFFRALYCQFFSSNIFLAVLFLLSDSGQNYSAKFSNHPKRPRGVQLFFSARVKIRLPKTSFPVMEKVMRSGHRSNKINIYIKIIFKITQLIYI